jgi:hypothetical protein
MVEKSDQIADLERFLKISLNAEVAVPIEWPQPWSSYPDLEIRLGNQSAALRYRKENPDRTSGIFVVATFYDCRAAKFSNVNDEIFESQRLFGRGLKLMGAHIVENSEWLSNLRKQHSTHRAFDPIHWTKIRHFILLYKDRTFECLAERFEIVQE